MLNAHTATRTDVGARSEELLAITNGLHHDRELGGVLGPAVTAGDCFRGIWIRRLTSEIGRIHARTRVTVLIQDLNIRIIDAFKRYQPTGRPPGPTR